MFLSHGRDHKLHVWSRIVAPIAVVESVSTSEVVSTPSLLYSLDVNSLNFCSFNLLALSDSPTALIALPNLVDSNYVSHLHILV
jgi:ASTRA-associated protein 1